MFSILIVEDSSVIRQRLRSLLRESGRVGLIVQAESETEALRHLELFKPEMAIIDLFLRSGSGLEVLRDLKVRVPSCLTVVLTNAATTEMREACLEAGADHVLHKATEFERLLEFLARLEKPKSVSHSGTDKP